MEQQDNHKELRDIKELSGARLLRLQLLAQRKVFNDEKLELEADIKKEKDKFYSEVDHESLRDDRNKVLEIVDKIRKIDDLIKEIEESGGALDDDRLDEIKRQAGELGIDL